MFKIRSLGLQEEYTQAQLANALIANVVYTYGDRRDKCGYDIATIPAGGDPEPGVTAMCDVVICVRPDATMFITDYATGKLGVVPLSNDEATFVAANASLMSDIADLMGYDDYVVYTLQKPAAGEQSRILWFVVSRDWEHQTDSVVIKRYTDAAEDTDRGIFTAPGAIKALFTLMNTPGMGDFNTPNGIVLWTAAQIRVPVEYYDTDFQNVQDVARQAVLLNMAEANGKFDTTTAALAASVELIGTLSVFGNTVKDVTARYNNISQYIPRP